MPSGEVSWGEKIAGSYKLSPQENSAVNTEYVKIQDKEKHSPEEVGMLLQFSNEPIATLLIKCFYVFI